MISKKISLGAILCALSVAILLIGSFMETVTFSCAAISAICVSVAVIELGFGYSFIIYAASTVLSFLLLPVKDPVLYFACFFGYYPMLKTLCEKLRRALEYALKGVCFSFSYALISFIGIKLLVSQTNLIKYVLLFFPVALAVFFAYDYALSKLVLYYKQTLRKRIGVDKFLR